MYCQILQWSAFWPAGQLVFTVACFVSFFDEIFALRDGRCKCLAIHAHINHCRNSKATICNHQADRPILLVPCVWSDCFLLRERNSEVTFTTDAFSYWDQCHFNAMILSVFLSLCFLFSLAFSLCLCLSLTWGSSGMIKVSALTHT